VRKPLELTLEGIAALAESIFVEDQATTGRRATLEKLNEIVAPLEGQSSPNGRSSAEPSALRVSE
jgi:hypothetical protein